MGKNNLNKPKIYGRMLVLSWCILLFWLAVRLVSGKGIEITSNSPLFIFLTQTIDNSFVLKWILGTISSILSTLLLWFSMMRIKHFENKNHFIFAFIYIGVVVAIKIANPYIGIAFDILTAFVIPFKILKVSAWDIYICNVMIIIAQSGGHIIKEISLKDFTTSSSLNSIISMIDIVLMLLIIYLYRKEGNSCRGCLCGGSEKQEKSLLQYVKIANLKNLLSFENTINALKRSMQGLQRCLTNAIDRQLFLRKITSYALIFGCIGLFSYFTDNFINSIILFICYISLRYLFPTTFHTTPLKCALLSITLFCIVLNNVLPLEISLLSAVFCAYAFDWALWIYQDRINTHIKVDELHKIISPVDQLKHEMRTAGFKEKEIIFACEIIFENKSIKEQSSFYGISEKSISNKRTILYKKLYQHKISYKKEVLRS